MSQAGVRGAAQLRRPTGAGIAGLLTVVAAALATFHTTDRLFLKQDVNFDLRHYHAYLGWSLFHGGLERDLHPALVGSYLNPALDVLNFVALSLVPAVVGSALLMVVQLSSAVPVYLMSRLLMPDKPRAAAAAAAALALGGALVTSEWGTTFGDLTVAPLLLWGLWCLLGATVLDGRRLVAGGLLLGAATGLKMTNATFALGAVVMVLVLAPRILALVRVGVSMGVGFLVAAGPWMVVMWRENHSPLFPLFNAQFKSPYAQQITAADTRFGADGLGELVLFPFRLVAAPAGFSSELPSSDWRWAVWVLSLVIVLVLIFLQLPGSPLTRGSLPGLWSVRSVAFRRLVAMQSFVLVAFSLWAVVFGIQRYAIVIELLTVPVIVATLGLLTAHRVVHLVLVTLLAVGLGLNTETVNWGRIDMPSGAAVPVGSVSSLQAYDGIILAATFPNSYVAVAVGGTTAEGTRPAWLAEPFTPADKVRGLKRLPPGRIGVLVRADAGDPAVPASAAAAWYDRRIVGACTPVQMPLPEVMLICETAAG